MKVKFSTVIMDLSGKPVPDPESNEAEKVATYRRMAVRALMVDTQGDKPEQKLTRFALALKISDGSDGLSVDEAKLLLDRVKQVCSTLLVGRFDQLLNGSAPAE